MAKTNVAGFVQQVRQEAGKVTWGTRKETFSATMVVLVMVLIASLFFLAVDGVISFIIRSLLGF